MIPDKKQKAIMRAADTYIRGAHYSMDVKVTAVALNLKCGVPVPKICSMLNIKSPQSVFNWKNDPEVLKQVELRYDIVESAKRMIGGKMAIAANMFIDQAMTPEKVASASFRDLVVATDVMTKGMAKENEKPTQTSIRVRVEASNDLALEIEILEKEIKQMEAECGVQYIDIAHEDIE